jgi:two-component system cell cycle response regulator
VPSDVLARVQDLAARLDELERHRSSEIEDRLAAARQAESDAADVGDSVCVMRARLVAGDMLQRLGRAAEAAQVVVAVNAWATANGPQSLLARSHLVISSLMENAGDLSGALDQAVRAIDLIDDDTPPRTRGNYLLRLADTLAMSGSTRESRERYDEAEAIFVEIDDRERRLSVLNNRAMLEYEAGNTAEALEAAERMLATSTRDELNAAFADSVARARLAAGDLAAAEDAALLGLDLWRERGDVSATTPAELGLTLTEVLVAQGRLDDAAEELARCLKVCRDRDLRGIAVDGLRVRSELLAARGDYENAYHAARDFHREWAALRSQQQEAAARTRQALYETAEARKEADRFRRLARTDPLTTLPNRRMVNEDLPRRLRDASAAGVRLSAVLIDVDHFKVVNDTYSHQAGDEVLRELGRLLAAALDDDRMPWELAARLGGEEFLLVMASDAPVEARARAEALRRRVAAHVWPGLPPEARVTVSAGIAVATPTDDQSSLLSRADVYLYQSKSAGRDRVTGDLPV